MARKLLPGSVFSDAAFAVVDNNDGSKVFQVQVSGVVGTVTMVVPNLGTFTPLTTSGGTVTGNLTLHSDASTSPPTLQIWDDATDSDSYPVIEMYGNHSGTGAETILNLDGYTGTPSASTYRASFFMSRGYGIGIWDQDSGGDSPFRIAWPASGGGVGGTIYLNGDGIDRDTNIRGLTDNNLVYVNAGNDRVGFGTNNPQEKVEIRQNLLVSDPAVGGYALLSISAGGSGSSYAETRYVINGNDTVVMGTGAADQFYCFDNVGNQSAWGFFPGANAIFEINPQGVDRDTRIYGLTDDNLFYTDAGNDRVGIGTNTPATKLHVKAANSTQIFAESTGANRAQVSIGCNSAGNQATIEFSDAGAAKWQFGKQTDNSWFIYDTVAGTNILSCASGGPVYSSFGVKSIHATQGIGYYTGAGGTVTQLTSKATGVTLNKVSGEITMNGAALAANTTVSFVFTNSAIAATDILILSHVTTGTFGGYHLNAHGFAAGSCTIDVRNITAGSLSEAIVIRFAVFKGSTS